MKPPVDFGREVVNAIPVPKVPTITEAVYCLTSTAAWEVGATSLRAANGISNITHKIASRALDGICGVLYPNTEFDTQQTFDEELGSGNL